MSRICSAFILPLAAMLSLSGCAKDRTIAAAPSVELTDLEALPEPDLAESAVIGPVEALEIRVVGAELITGSYTTDENGMLRFPFLGEIQAAGLSTSQLATRIANGLRGQYVQDPQVIVRSERPLRRSISIGGQVESPGTYEASTSQTLIRAVNNAGGMTEYAQTDDVLVMRKVNGQSYIGVYNLEAIQRGNYADPRIFSNDIIMVGDSPSRRLLDGVLTFVPLLATSVVLIDRIGN